ncbi:MAG: YihY/virulence factor BrkB family protein [Anaerolineales bacterium]
MIAKQLEDFYHDVNRVSGGRLDILKNAITTFSATRASHAAAALAYYAIFSLFPLMLVLIATGSFFLDRQQVYQSVTNFVQETFPVSQALINDNLREILDARGAVGLIGLITLLWSASGVFTNLAYHINLAWAKAAHRNFFRIRLVGLGMIGTLTILLLISLIAGWITSLISLFVTESASFPFLQLWHLLSKFVSWLVIFLLYTALYHWVPTVRVDRAATLWSALFATIGWKVATACFNWYIRVGFDQYRLIYGSVGTIVALLFLIFILSTITLFGAHLCAAIDLWKKERAQAN